MIAAHPKHARVLIADDSVVSQGVLVILLENAGYDVISVNDGHKAMEALRAHAFDLALLDDEMPNLDGIGAVAEIRSTLPRLPVIVCVATNTNDHATRYRELGVNDLLTKPVDPHVVRDKITRILSHHQPQSPATNESASPFRGLHATTDVPVASPLASGSSRYAKKLQTELRRLRDFRSVAILEGPLGSGRFELALSLAPAVNTHTFVCQADELSAAHLDLLFKPAAATTNPVFLVILEAHRLDTQRQTFLEELIHGRVEALAALATRLRVVLCTQRSLCDLHFNELLLMRAVTATLIIPDFVERWMDWAEIARAVLRRVGAGRGTLDAEAIRWINRHKWTGDYMQLHRTIEIARRLAGVASVLTVAHLEAAVAAEPTCNDPLFHDLLYHVHSGG
jgi:DNA-binding NtrC family response regulator